MLLWEKKVSFSRISVIKMIIKRHNDFFKINFISSHEISKDDWMKKKMNSILGHSWITRNREFVGSAGHFYHKNNSHFRRISIQRIQYFFLYHYLW